MGQNLIMTKRLQISLIAGLLLCRQTASADALKVPQCSRPPAIDGMLDDACWSNALPLNGFDHVVAGNPETDKGAHTAYLTAGSEWLYVGVKAAHPNPAAIKPVAVRHGGRIQGENCIKFSFAPGEKGDDYFHFRLSAGNVRDEMRASDKKWRIPWRSAARITEEGWQAEMAFPLAPIAGWPVINKARMNVMVVSLLPETNSAGDPDILLRRIMTSWGPQAGTSSFLPSQVFDFGGLRWNKTFLPLIEECRIKEYRIGEHGLECLASVKTRAYGGVDGIMQLTVLAGGTAKSSRPIEFSGDAEGQASIVAPVSGADNSEFKICLVHPATGELWQDIFMDTRSDPGQGILTAFAEYNYYTAESNANVVCQVRVAEPDLSFLRLSARDAEGELLAGNRTVLPETDLLIPITRLRKGRQIVRIELLARNDRLLAAREAEIIRRDPNPGHAVKIDHRRRIVRVNGRPFFPVGFWYMGSPSGLEELGQTDFNAVQRGGSAGAIDLMQKFMDEAQANNLMVIPSLENMGARHESGQSSMICHVKCQMIYSAQRGDSTYDGRSRKFEEAFERDLPAILDGVKTLKDHPALLAWYTFDEPANKNYFALYKQGRELTRRVNELDGYHPVYMMGMQGIKTADEDTDWCDIMGHDPYWVPARREKSQIDYVSWLTRRMRQLGDEERKPIWMILIAERIAASYKRYVNAREQRCQTYLALIAGARGIIYYHWPIRFQAHWEEFCRLAREIKELSPALLGAEAPQNIVVENAPDANRGGDLPAALFRYPDGRYVLLCANYHNYPLEVAWQIAGPEIPVRVSEYSAGMPYFVKDGGFDDRLEPWGTRAYLLDFPEKAAFAIRAAITARLAEAVDEEPALLFGASRPGFKNLKPNPGFEEAANPGWPDYYDPPWFRDPSERIGLPGCPYRLDPENPADGKVALRIETRGGYGLGFLFRRPGPLTLSRALRAMAEGVGARLEPAGGKSARFNLTDKWQRYNLKLEDGISGQVNLNFDPESVVWVDAIQIEAGTEMTEYEP